MKPSKASKARSDKNQRERFIKTARERGASDDEAVFDENLKKIAKAKAKETEKMQK